MGVCAGTRARSVRISVAMVLTVALAWAVLGVTGAGIAQARSFSDVDSSVSYHLQIQVLSQLGVINGFNDGTFRPDSPVTRQQFAKMVVLSMRMPVGEGDICKFVDVPASGPDDLYPDNYVAAVAREGVTTGTRAAGKGLPALFSPWDSISLAQVVTMVTRASGTPLSVAPDGYHSDWGDFDPAHGPTARTAQYNGLLRELPGVGVSPWRPATRAEATAVLYNLMGTDVESVTGRFLGTSGDLVAYFRDHGQTGEKFTVPLQDLARLYVKYGRRFGIRADVAWAQMVHETGWGRYGGDVLPDQNNMAGIGATGGGEPGNVFATAEHGVVAHIVHLAWYAYPGHLEDPFCRRVYEPDEYGDPRHFEGESGPHRGNVRVVQGLGGKWAPSPQYGEAVLNHALGIAQSKGW